MFVSTLFLSFAGTGPDLSHDPFVEGGSATLTVSGADPFETVYFVASRSAGPGPCPNLLGGLCVGVVSPKLLGNVVADATGAAQLNLNLPGSLVAGDQVALQGAIPRGPGGIDSVVTAVAIATVTAAGGVDVDGDGYDASVDCDDGDASVYPGALEVCDGVDTDCDPTTSEDGLITANGAVNYTSLADASSFTPAGGVIDVCPGTYDASMVITAPLTFNGVGDPGDVVLDGVGAGPKAIEITPTADGTVLRNLTLDGADGDYGLYIDAVVTLDTMVITHSDVTKAPVHTRRIDNDLTVLDSVLSNNVGGDSGGLWLRNVDTQIERTSFLSNTSTSEMGAAITLDASVAVVELVDSVVEGNFGGVDGAAVWFDWNNGTFGNELQVTNTDFGAGLTENLPADVHLDGPDLDYFTYQAGSSFTCDDSSCF